MTVPAGYLSGNPRRRQILEVLNSRGPLPLQGVAHLIRMAPPLTQGLLEDLGSKGLVEAKGDKFHITPPGEELLKRFGRES